MPSEETSNRLECIPLLPEIIHTERLILRPSRESDVDDILTYATDPRWAKFLPVPQPYEREHAISFVRAQLAADRRKHPSWAIEHGGRAVGAIDVTFKFEGNQAEFGYSIAPSLWGQGLVTEAARRIVQLSFQTYSSLARINSSADVENIGSLRVLEKLGMTRDGILRKPQMLRGEDRDVVLFYLPREDWEKSFEQRR